MLFRGFLAIQMGGDATGPARDLVRRDAQMVRINARLKRSERSLRKTCTKKLVSISKRTVAVLLVRSVTCQVRMNQNRSAAFTASISSCSTIRLNNSCNCCSTVTMPSIAVSQAMASDSTSQVYPLVLIISRRSNSLKLIPYLSVRRRSVNR